MKYLLFAIISVVCSRVIFLFINDPEGPNLLVVLAGAVVVYLVLWGLSSLFRRSSSK
jgi:hypothetical protein